MSLENLFESSDTDPRFWDCNCQDDYIHLKKDYDYCDKCGIAHNAADPDSVPDSRCIEVYESGLISITPANYAKEVKELWHLYPTPDKKGI